MFSKTEKLLGKNQVENLKQKNICIVGIGGVGGYVADFLARTGIQNFTLIDFDIVEPSNINRQIIALNSTINQNKAVLMSNRIKDINPNCSIKIIKEKLEQNNISKIINSNFDYVVDCIDIVKDKLDLIKYCKINDIKIISSMGAGNRISIPEYEIKDIFKTNNDGLARVIRKNLRDNNIKNLDVCICKNGADINMQEPASVVWHPAVCGAVISAYVVNELIKS